MEIIACRCEEGFGIPHTHVGRMHVFEQASGNQVRLDDWTVEHNVMPSSWRFLRVEEPCIRVWIDWKAVSKAIMTA